MNKGPLGLSNELKGLCKVMGEFAISGLPNISETIGSNLLKVVSETSALTASLHQSTSWILQPDVLKPITDALEWANKLQFQHALDEIKRVVESPQYIAAIKSLTSFTRDFDWQWLVDLQTKYDAVPASAVEEIASQVTEEEKKQICEDIMEFAESAKHGLADVERKYGELKEKHPLLMEMVIMLISFILGQLLPQPATTTTVSNIYEAPASTSYIVCNTTVNQTINIIGEAPYYYNVILVDPQTGTEYQGYIYKANVSVDSPTTEDDTETNETIPLENDEIKSVQTEDKASSE